MKKIIGILAAATIAASVFAVDIAANVHGWTDLFNYDLAADDAKPQFMGVRDPFDREFAWSSTGIGFTFNGDKAGTSFELDNRDVTVKHVKLYVQPFDALKITVGDTEVASNVETIDWTKMSAYSSEGWLFDITPVDGLAINVKLTTGEARGWGWAFWGSNGKVKETTAKVGYSADFGSLFAMFDYNDPTNVITAGYSGSFGSVSIFTDFAYTMKENDNAIGVDFFVNGSVDAIGYKAYVKFTRGLDTEVNALQAKLLINYGTSAGTAYFKAVIPNAMQDDFPVQIYPGFQFNIGSASIDAGVQFNLNTDADANAGKGGQKSISVPVIYKVSL